MKRLILLLALILVNVINAFAQSEYTDEYGVTWTFEPVSETEARITAASGYGADVIVPEKVTDGTTEFTVTIMGPVFASNKVVVTVSSVSVTTIEYQAFRSASKLQSVNFAQCIDIGEQAFCVCSSLKTAIFKNCKTIGDNAFKKCPALTNINLSNCTSLGSYALSGTKISNVDLSNCTSIGSHALSGTAISKVDLTNCTSIGSYAFSNCKNLVEYGSLKISEIPDGLFSGCSSINSVDLSNCTSLGSYALSGTAISKVDLSNITSIGSYALSGTAISKVDLSNCTSIGSYAFSDCKNLVECGSLNISEIPEGLFKGCEALANINLADFTSSIGSYALAGTAIAKIDLSNCTSIGLNALENCKYLKDVNLPNCQTVAAFAFNNCTSLKTVNLPSCTGLGREAFLNTHAIITFAAPTPPAQKTDFEYFCFRNVIIVPEELVTTYQTADGWSRYASQILSMSAQTEYDITTDLSNNKDIYTLIGENNLKNVVDLKITGDIASFDVLMLRTKTPLLHYLDLSEANFVKREGDEPYYYVDTHGYVTNRDTIGAYAFYNLDKLVEVKLPKTTKIIGSWAFASCENLKSVMLPDGLEVIESYAFSGCPLSSIKLPKTLVRINTSAFSDCDLDSVELPMGLEMIGDWAFQYNNIQEIKIPSSVRYMGGDVFDELLKSVYMYTLDPNKLELYQNTFNLETKTNGILYYPVEDSCDVRNRFYYRDAKWADFQNLRTFKGKYEYVAFDKDYYLSDERLEGDGIEVDLNAGSGLTVEGEDEQVFGDVHVKHDGDVAGAIVGDGNIDADKLFFDIQVNPGKWYFFSFPFKVLFGDVKYPGQYVWYEYDGTKRAENGSGGWTKITDYTSSLNRGCGYIFQSSEAGTLQLMVRKENFGKFESDEYKHELATYAADNAYDASWNFMGNPHTGYYGIADMGYEAPITVWDSENNTYKAVRPGDDDYQLQPFEAFFVQKPEGVNEVEFDGEQKKTYTQAQEEMSAAKIRRLARGANKERMLINLTISDGVNTDNTRVVFNAKQTKAYEMNCDAAKFMSTESVPQLYTMNDNTVEYAINERPEGSVNLGYVAAKAGELTIEAVRMDNPVLLKDLVAGITFDLSNGSYTFDTAKGVFNNRFVLLPDTESTGIAEVQGKTGVSIMTTEGGVSLAGTTGKNVSVYSVAGAQVVTNPGDGITALKAGSYIITVDGLATKVYVK